MKQLEIKTNKRLLIVEYPNDKSFQDDLSFYRKFKIGGFEQYIVEFICKGSDLTEDIAKALVEEIYHTSVSFYKDYNSEKPYEIGFHCEIKSFISAIEAAGYHWGENPVKFPIYSTITYGTMPGSYSEFMKDVKSWNESESRTFNPSKCIIFEIL